MDIIINPTNKCNFDCKFCMAKNIPSNTLTSKETIDRIKVYGDNINLLIINGGDPLMMDPQYYRDLIDYVETIDHMVYISLTTNLYDWYIHPQKWHDIFSDNHIGVMTSFQYGNKRRLCSGKVYTEDLFIDVVNKFNEEFGYKPNFISVIDNDNDEYSVQTVELAKSLGIKCKLNKVLTLGRGTDIEYYPRYKMIDKHCEIIDHNLSDYDLSIDNFRRYFNGQNTCCPLCKDCYNGIRTINSDNRLYQCGNLISEDRFRKYEIKNPYDYDKFRRDNSFITSKCLGCSNYNFCNSCSADIEEVHRMHDEDMYCIKMKKAIKELGDRLVC